MFHDLLKLYLENPGLGSLLDVDMLSPDSHLYLLADHAKWYVVSEEDYMSMGDKVNEIEVSFPVSVVGWRVLRDKQKAVGTSLLPRTSFEGRDLDSQSDDVETIDAYYRDYNSTVYSNSLGTGLLANRLSYALLEVKPNPGIDEASFGLSFYRDVSS